MWSCYWTSGFVSVFFWTLYKVFSNLLVQVCMGARRNYKFFLRCQPMSCHSFALIFAWNTPNQIWTNSCIYIVFQSSPPSYILKSFPSWCSMRMSFRSFAMNVALRSLERWLLPIENKNQVLTLVLSPGRIKRWLNFVKIVESCLLEIQVISNAWRLWFLYCINDLCLSWQLPWF